MALIIITACKEERNETDLFRRGVDHHSGRIILGSAAKKGCEELKGEIAAKLDSKGVKNYSLEIVASDSVKDEKVVGTCEAGSKSIVYKRN